MQNENARARDLDYEAGSDQEGATRVASELNDGASVSSKSYKQGLPPITTSLAMTEEK